MAKHCSGCGSFCVSHYAPQLRQPAHPEFLNAVERASHPLAHLGKCQTFQMPKNHRLAVIFGEFLQGIGQKHGLFAAGRLMAGRTAPVDQARSSIRDD